MPTPTSIDPRHAQHHQKVPRVEVYWTTVTYKTVILYSLVALGVVFGGMYLAKPELYSAVINKIHRTVGNADVDPVNADQKHAKFVNLDGRVQIKKFNSVQWVDATLSTALDKGDLVETGSDGDARISFADGTSYTIKPDTLITVEENSTESNRPTSVTVSIQTGAVDLATPYLRSPDSKAAVKSEDATTQLHSNSRAAVKFDPEKKESEVVVSSGTAQVQRGEEKIDLVQYEKATIPSTGAIQKSTVLKPPELVEPLNLAPIIAENPKTATVHFEWKPVPEAASYRLRVSATSMLTRNIVDKKNITGTSVDVTGLETGDYFWNVMATDAKKESSELGDIFRFSLVAQGKSQDMILEITGYQLHGRVAEIIGKTEPGAALIVNGQPVPNIAADGTFRHFTEPLEPGQHSIVVVGQNRRGGTGHAQVSIVVPK
ncbi:MAG: FecR domain-containing protein [Acidobacteria bacterium Pan2503]|uniref:FecR domain-containing protein n=1 Tax=Candidatus Acidiferrum panamense TaxID=2741543 RepID=A0A7V8NLM8_9BACT|nr:FecR domain-containing protein [Candidatus Acidoferrum panamensis]